MPDRRLDPVERNETSATSVVAQNGQDIDPSVWRPEHRRLLELAARDPAVDRIFVNPAIKRALCREVTGDRGWLHRIRPGSGTIITFMCAWLAPAAHRSARARRRCRPATGVAPISPGGSRRKPSCRNRPSPPDRCGFPTCRTPAPLS